MEIYIVLTPDYEGRPNDDSLKVNLKSILQVDNLKIDSLKIDNLKIDNLKIDNLKIDNLKIDILKIKNLKMFFFQVYHEISEVFNIAEVGADTLIGRVQEFESENCL